MSWSDRQRRMLAAMGLRVFVPAAPVTSAASAASASAPDAGAGAAGEDAGVALLSRPAAIASPRPVARPATPAVAAPAATAPAPVVARPPPAPVLHPSPAPAGLPAAPADEADPALAGRAAAIATQDWATLQAGVAACTACGLCATRRQTVFGVGHAHARWMVVGEAPGEQEDLAGEPFVGPAGQLLDQMLRAVGRTRRAPDGSLDEAAGDPAQRVYIANSLKCRPPRNRNPAPDELERCAPFLRRQVELVQPALILALGRFAVKSLLDSDEPIGRLRGRVHRHAGIPVVVSYHPSYLLRTPLEKARAWEDLCFARAVDAG